MGRAERRAAARLEQRWATEERLSPEGQRIARAAIARKSAMDMLAKNGITVEDLEKEYDRGYADARKQLVRFTAMMFYAALGIALHEIYRFGAKRILRTFERVQRIMEEEICSDDICARLEKDTGIKIKETNYDN